MKNLFIVLLAIAALSSCQKEDFGQYHTELENTYNEPHDSTYYIYGGTLPNTGTATNDLVGTQWVLTKYVSAFATEYPNDTIDFVSFNTYTINGGAVRTYQLASIPSSTNFDLSLYFFFPFGGSHYSGNVGGMFIQDGEINGAEFHNIQNTTSTIRAWFIKI
jgi:hypothetical protein